jgi:AcrR family transcriptional regulator
MIDLLPPGFEGSTRDRLLAAGIRLFADRGFRGTTVGAIEAAAGLQPRRGALYHHFASKQALLEAAIETHLVAIEHGRQQLEAMPGSDVRSEALAIGRWFLGELDVQRYLTRILEKDGDRLPEIRDLIRERIIETGHRAAQAALVRWLGSDSNLDLAALAVILVAPVVNLRRAAWTFGKPPLDLDDDRLLNSWADMCARFAADLVPPSQ